MHSIALQNGKIDVGNKYHLVKSKQTICKHHSVDTWSIGESNGKVHCSQKVNVHCKYRIEIPCRNGIFIFYDFCGFRPGAKKIRLVSIKIMSIKINSNVFGLTTLYRHLRKSIFLLIK